MSLDVGALYRNHAMRVWRYARARVPSDADAEDVTSEVFLRAMTALSTYDPTKGSQAAWIVGVARHTAADWWRRHGRAAGLAGTVPDEAGSGDDPADHAVRRDETAQLSRQLAVLSDREHEAIALRFGAELPSAEIGELMGISAPAARMLVYRGLTKLKEAVDDE